ncbi:MAG: YdcF family protein [Verrucomicrobia bacterium]|nr:YdcF family protein [Verrucomicrobiota bacterium]
MRETFHTKTAGTSGVENVPPFWRRISMGRTKGLRLVLVQRRLVWCPTWLGAFCLVALLVSPMAWWYFWGERFLSTTCRLPADVLVVEGWIGQEGVDAAGAEFRQHGYQYVVTTGTVTGERWETDRWSYADVAERELIRLGIPRDRVIVAFTGDARNRRTFQSAVTACQALRARGIQPKGLNVFTLGPHAARSRLVFTKVFSPGTKVGVIDWTPSDYEPGPWWHSSERAREMISETAGYLFEYLFNSGRSSNTSNAPTAVSRQQPGRSSGDPRGSRGAESENHRVAVSGFPRGRNGTFWTAALISP